MPDVPDEVIREIAERVLNETGSDIDDAYLAPAGWVYVDIAQAMLFDRRFDTLDGPDIDDVQRRVVAALRAMSGMGTKPR